MPNRPLASALAVVAASLFATSARAESVAWSSSASAFACVPGARHTLTCPAGGKRETVWGSGPYTDDSSVCTAAVHAGAVSFDKGGAVTIEMRAGDSAYTSSSVNGVPTSTWGAWRCGFVVVRASSTRKGADEVVVGGESTPDAPAASVPDPEPGARRASSGISAAPRAVVYEATDTPPSAAPRRDEPREQTGVALGMDLVRTSAGEDALRFGNYGMLGLRTSMHGRAGRRVAIVLGMEEAFGTDPSGYRRYDFALALPELYFYVTPDSILQFYTLTGLDLRLSHFDAGPAGALPPDLSWAYFYLGGTIGAGVETRLHDKTALRFEVRGFLRGRTTDSSEPPAFAAATGTSKGVSLGIGAAFY